VNIGCIQAWIQDSVVQDYSPEDYLMKNPNGQDQDQDSDAQG